MKAMFCFMAAMYAAGIIGGMGLAGWTDQPTEEQTVEVQPIFTLECEEVAAVQETEAKRELPGTTSEAASKSPDDVAKLRWVAGFIPEWALGLLGLLGVFGVYGMWKFLGSRHLLCWLRHKRKYGEVHYEHDKRGRTTAMRRWVCARCTKMGVDKEARGIWRAVDGKLVADTDSWLAGM